MHNSQDLIFLFNELFESTEQTILVGGGAEPLYLPRDNMQSLHKIIFTKDYYASALHEIAHWCLADKNRRQLIDYGYWYTPDGRTAEQQLLFEQVEIKSQALEYLFAMAASSPFRVSLDNLLGEPTDSSTFKENVQQQAKDYLKFGLPIRAKLFRDKLIAFYKPRSTS